MFPKTFYDTLQVSRQASPSVIRAAYRALSQKHHPDKHPNDQETAHKNMKRLNEAYEVLSDAERKAAYDLQIEAIIAESIRGAKKPPPPSPPPEPPPRPSASTPPPYAPGPPPAHADLNRSEGASVGVTAWLVIAGVFLVALIFNQSSSSPSDGEVAARPTNQSNSVPVVEPAPTPHSMSTLAVAALNANVRKEASAKSKAIAILARGAPIEQIDEVNGFVKFNLPDGREGWISRDIVVPRFSAIRLGGLSAVDYVKARAPLRGIEQLFTALEPYSELQLQALFQIVSESPQLDETLQQLASSVRITSENADPDPDAVSWYSLEARYYVENNKSIDGLESARAAVFADPVNIDAHVAFAYAAIRVDDFDVLRGVATILPTLAPNSTNTWVIVGISAANRDDSVLATNALLLALRKSRNPKVTIQVLAEMANRSSSPKVSQAIKTALERWTQNS